jgi:hypothetical protein
VFLNSPYREAPKNAITKIEKKIGFGFLVDFFVKTFRHDFFCKTFFCGAFELPSLRNTRKRDKTKKIEEKLTSDIEILTIFLENVFDMDFLQKYFCGVFELPLPRNTRKRTKKKGQEKNQVGWWVLGGSGIQQMHEGPVDLFFCQNLKPGGPSFWLLGSIDPGYCPNNKQLALACAYGVEFLRLERGLGYLYLSPRTFQRATRGYTNTTIANRLGSRAL